MHAIEHDDFMFAAGYIVGRHRALKKEVKCAFLQARQ